MPYSPVSSPRNILSKLVGYEKLIDDPNSITSADTLLATINHLIDDWKSPLWGRISLVYDKGITSPFKIGSILSKVGLRQRPKFFEKFDLDSWHKPKRVNTVLSDPIFEEVIKPPMVENELPRVVELYAQSLKITKSLDGF